jgi:plastocyanin
MSDLFYVFGLALTVMALVVAFAGMRMEKFPTRGALLGGIGLMSFLVVGTAAFAIVLSREEKEHRDEEIAEYREANQDEALAQIDGQAVTSEEGGSEAGGEEESGSAGPEDVEPAEGEVLELTSPDAGDLVFDPEALTAEAGSITINYVNPSPVPHNVAIEDGDETISQGETVTNGDAGPAMADLEPGEYVFYCSVPSHREAGMEGALTVE